MEKNQNNEYIIKGKLQEKDEEVKGLEKKYNDMHDILKKVLTSLSSSDEMGKQSVAKTLIENGVFK